jgi:hypothetical protein
MKYQAIWFTAILLVACTRQNLPEVVATPNVKLPEITTSSYVKAEPMPGNKIRVSVTAPDKELYIVNCNQHITTALFQKGSREVAWGGASDACLSPSIIIPAKATLSFTVDVSAGADKSLKNGFYKPLTNDNFYQVQIYHVLSGSDLKSASIPSELVTSNEFQLIP